MQYIRLLLFYSVIFQSCKFQSPAVVGLTGIGVARVCTCTPGRRKVNDSDCDSHSFLSNLESLTSRNYTSTVQTAIDRRIHTKTKRLTQTCKSDLACITIYSPTIWHPPAVNHIQTSASAVLRTLICPLTIQHCTVQPRDSGRLAPPTEPTESRGGRLSIPNHKLHNIPHLLTVFAYL